jgi:hypothetical protein
MPGTPADPNIDPIIDQAAALEAALLELLQLVACCMQRPPHFY